VYHPYLVFVEANCWYELTAYKLAHYRVKYRRMMICVFTYDRLMPSQAAGLMGNGADSFLDLRDDDGVTGRGIARVIRGDSYMPEWVSEAPEDYEGPENNPGLTRKEQEVLRLVGMPLSLSVGGKKLTKMHNFRSSLKIELSVLRYVLPFLPSFQYRNLSFLNSRLNLKKVKTDQPPDLHERDFPL
jgi:hypothetical protein